MPVTFAALGDYGVGIVNGEAGRRQAAVARTLTGLADHRGPLCHRARGQHLRRGPGPAGAVRRRGRRLVLHVLRAVPARHRPAALLPGGRQPRRSRTRKPTTTGLSSRTTSTSRPLRAPGGARAGVTRPRPLLPAAPRRAGRVDLRRHVVGRPGGEALVRRRPPPRVADRRAGRRSRRRRWRIPFSHHPAWCAGPNHPGMREHVDGIVPHFRAAGVRLTLHGHEHNLQHGRVDGIDYVISGAGGKLDERAPADFAAAGTRSWAAEAHCLLVDVTADQITVTPYAGMADDEARATDRGPPDARRREGDRPDHREPLTSITATVTLSGPPRPRAVDTRRRASASGVVLAGRPDERASSVLGPSSTFHSPSVQSTSRPGPSGVHVAVSAASARRRRASG